MYTTLIQTLRLATNAFSQSETSLEPRQFLFSEQQQELSDRGKQRRPSCTCAAIGTVRRT